MPFLLFLSGASGSGKTTVVNHIEIRLAHRRFAFLNFDSIGIPSREEMIAQAGSLECWQEQATHQWTARISKDYQSFEIVILEGQANPDFVKSGCIRHGITGLTIVLLDCDWDIRSRRLIHERKQPELATAEMKNWADFLRNQAKQKDIIIIDTSNKSPRAVADEIIALLPS